MAIVGRKTLDSILILEVDANPSGTAAPKGSMAFLNDMADKYQGSAKKFAEAKGMTGIITEYAALKEGDKRLYIEDKA